jgi:hypothetical protein
MQVWTTRALAACAASAWLASWFLPVIEGYAGWEAFRAALAGPFSEAYPGRGQESIPQLLSALTNVVFVVLLYGWFRGRTLRSAMFLKLAVACVLLNLYWPVQTWRAGERDALLVGYYLWLAAFLCLLALGIVSAVSDRRTSRTPTAGTPA